MRVCVCVCVCVPAGVPAVVVSSQILYPFGPYHSSASLLSLTAHAVLAEAAAAVHAPVPS